MRVVGLPAILVLPLLACTALCSAGPLVDAVRDGNRTEALALLEQHADANDRMVDGTTPLHWAVHNGDADLVQRLIKAGANVAAINDYGSTPCPKPQNELTRRVWKCC